MINSILCEDVKIPKIGSKIVFEYIIELGSSWKDSKIGVAERTLTDNSPEGIIDLCNELRKDADDNHHVYIEGFELMENAKRHNVYQVWLGS